MREGREREQMMKIMYRKTHQKNTKKKRRSIGKGAFYMLKFQNTPRFTVKNGANCETPFPVFFLANFVTKTSISGLIRVVFGSNWETPGGAVSHGANRRFARNHVDDEQSERIDQRKMGR